VLTLLFVDLGAFAEPSVKDAVDSMVSRLYATLDPDALRALTQDEVLRLITPEEKRILATKECFFDVNVPVTVSVIRSAHQKPVPFWIEEAGFRNTGDRVTSEWYTHEVWQKDFDAGRIELGINGFDNERRAYFVCVGPQRTGDDVTISNLYPEEAIITVGPKTWTYRDWDDLYIDEYPDYLEGQLLITTFRGPAKQRTSSAPSVKRPFPHRPCPTKSR